jgi:zinc transport system permease protein
LSGMMLMSSALCALFTTAGLWLSYAFDLPSGATIVLFSGSVFLLSSLVHRAQ